MKRYLLFAGEWYYPSGGWSDKVAESDDVDELKVMLRYERSRPPND